MTRLSALSELLASEKLLEEAPVLGDTARKLCTLFASRFGHASDSPAVLGFVPGRIEVAGKHTDYAGGHTLVCAIDKGFFFIAGANLLGKIRIVEDSPEFEPLEFPFTADVRPPAGRWANYPMTMAQRIAANFGQAAQLGGVDIAFASTMPVGSGMSGSSALMMMCFCAIVLVNRLSEVPLFRENIHDGIDLAMYLACAENGQSFRGLPGGRGVGTFGGSEDQTAILDCREKTVSLYQYAPTVLKGALSWPPDWSLIVAFSGVRAEKTGAAMEKYNLASRRAARAVIVYNELHGTGHRHLADIEQETRGRPVSRWLAEMEGKSREERELDLPGRIRHYLLEERDATPRAVRALLWRDPAEFGAALSASHAASRRLLWNIAPEIDHLQRSAVKLGAAGATGFGAGFGGSAFAVVDAAKAAELAAAWRASYERRHPERAREAEFFITAPASGIRVWDKDGSARFVDLVF